MFSERVDKIHMNMLENNIKYRITMKASYHIIVLLLVFQKLRVIGNETF